MTRDEALHKVKGYLTDIIPVENYSEVEEIIKALEQEPCEPCEDCIIRWVYKNKAIERTGKWIVERYCSECEWDKHEAELVCNIPTNYCPNCGARMKGGAE